MHYLVNNKQKSLINFKVEEIKKTFLLSDFVIILFIRIIVILVFKIQQFSHNFIY